MSGACFGHCPLSALPRLTGSFPSTWTWQFLGVTCLFLLHSNMHYLYSLVPWETCISLEGYMRKEKKQQTDLLVVTELWVKYLELCCWSYVKVKGIQSCLILWDPMDCTVHGILQARILDWVAVPFSRGSSQPRDWTQVSGIAGRSLPTELWRKPVF